MANFPTHLAVGTVASGMMATLATASGMVKTDYIIALALAGALGSVLPDIDLKDSRSSRIIFFALGLFISFVVLFCVVDKYSIVELWIVWIGVFLAVRYFGHLLFHHFAVHRGVFHSILAGLFFLFATAAIFYHGLGIEAGICWLAGIFMFFGYIVHLLLDEIYSVDFNGNRVKRSFGTALKLYEHRDIAASFVMLSAVVGVFFVTPEGTGFYDAVSTSDVWAQLWQRMLPSEGWFGFDVGRGEVAVAPVAAP